MDEVKRLIFKQWTPKEVPWSVWAKPVLFASIHYRELSETKLPEISVGQWASQLDSTTAVIMDLPDEEGILEGLALVNKGYWPVPLYNGCRSIGMINDVSSIVRLLVVGGRFLSNVEIRPDFRPVFILDSRRMDNGNMVRPGRFDNRWCVVPQDMPSAKYLKDMGIDRIVLRSDRVRNDLNHILCRYQDSNIQIELCRDDDLPMKMNLRPPLSFRGFGYRWSVFWGLKRNATGGFGDVIPAPSTSTGTSMRSSSRMG